MDEYEAQDMTADARSAKQFGQQKGPKYIMAGRIMSIVKQVGREKDVYYKITLNVVNIQSGVIEWADEKEIRKAAPGGSSGADAPGRPQAGKDLGVYYAETVDRPRKSPVLRGRPPIVAALATGLTGCKLFENLSKKKAPPPPSTTAAPEPVAPAPPSPQPRRRASPS